MITPGRKSLVSPKTVQNYFLNYVLLHSRRGRVGKCFKYKTKLIELEWGVWGKGSGKLSKLTLKLVVKGFFLAKIKSLP